MPKSKHNLYCGCLVKDCDRPNHAKGYCNRHYTLLVRHGSTDDRVKVPITKYKGCAVEGCPLKHKANGYCFRHHSRARRGWDVNSAEFKYLDRYNNKYNLLVEKYPTLWINGRRIMIHVMIAEKALGRKLRGTEMVHHVNGYKQDYRPANLVIMTRKYHREHYIKLHIWQYGGERPVVYGCYPQVGYSVYA